jgi:hypothetical protein
MSKCVQRELKLSATVDHLEAGCLRVEFRAAKPLNRIYFGWHAMAYDLLDGVMPGRRLTFGYGLGGGEPWDGR